MSIWFSFCNRELGCSNASCVAAVKLSEGTCFVIALLCLVTLIDASSQSVATTLLDPLGPRAEMLPPGLDVFLHTPLATWES